MDIRPNSEKVMSIMNNAVDDIKKIKDEQREYFNEFNEKLKIVDCCNAYTESMILNRELATMNAKPTDRYIFNYDKQAIVGGRFDSYGQVVHAKFIKLPEQVFNYITEIYPVYINNGIVEFYTDIEKKDTTPFYSNMLKHEGCPDKHDVFKTFKEDTFTMAVQFDMGATSWTKTFDMIELCPYLQGSFDILNIRIYTAEQYYTKDLVAPARTLTNHYPGIGLTRIKLDKKYDFYRIEFDIRVKYEDEGFPFGLRHIYFYDSDADSDNDYIVLEVKKEDYIRYIGEDITVITPRGNIETKADQYGVEFYMLYQGGELQVPLSNPIARNITKFYAKIPLKEPLIGIEFKDIIAH